MLGLVDGTLHIINGLSIQADPLDKPQQAAHMIVNRVDGHRARLDRRTQLRAPRTRRPRHFKVKPAVGVLHRLQRRAPVADDDAVETPLGFQNAVQEFIVGTGENAVDAIIGGHHGPDISFLHRRFERRQVELAQRAFVHVGTDGVALELRVVRHVMFRASGDADGLNALNVSDGKL